MAQFIPQSPFVAKLGIVAGGRGGREGHRHLQGGLNGLATHLVKPAGGDVEDEPPQGFVFGDERACLDAAQ